MFLLLRLGAVFLCSVLVMVCDDMHYFVLRVFVLSRFVLSSIVLLGLVCV